MLSGRDTVPCIAENRVLQSYDLGCPHVQFEQVLQEQVLRMPVTVRNVTSTYNNAFVHASNLCQSHGQQGGLQTPGAIQTNTRSWSLQRIANKVPRTLTQCLVITRVVKYQYAIG